MLSFTDNPGLILWPNIAGEPFFFLWREIKLKNKSKIRARHMFMLSLLRVSLQTITEANGSLAWINHSNIHN